MTLCLSVCLSVTSQSSIETAGRIKLVFDTESILRLSYTMFIAAVLFPTFLMVTHVLICEMWTGGGLASMSEGPKLEAWKPESEVRLSQRGQPDTTTESGFSCT